MIASKQNHFLNLQFHGLTSICEPMYSIRQQTEDKQSDKTTSLGSRPK